MNEKQPNQSLTERQVWWIFFFLSGGLAFWIFYRFWTSQKGSYAYSLFSMLMLVGLLFFGSVIAYYPKNLPIHEQS